MPGRGPQTFKKRQKEQQRKERQQEKFAKRLQRKEENRNPEPPEQDLDNALSDSPESAAQTNGEHLTF
jgi:hypothetical protein